MKQVHASSFNTNCSGKKDSSSNSRTDKKIKVLINLEQKTKTIVLIKMILKK